MVNAANVLMIFLRGSKIRLRQISYVRWSISALDTWMWSNNRSYWWSFYSTLRLSPLNATRPGSLEPQYVKNHMKKKWNVTKQHLARSLVRRLKHSFGSFPAQIIKCPNQNSKPINKCTFSFKFQIFQASYCIQIDLFVQFKKIMQNFVSSKTPYFLLNQKYPKKNWNHDEMLNQTTVFVFVLFVVLWRRKPHSKDPT